MSNTGQKVVHVIFLAINCLVICIFIGKKGTLSRIMQLRNYQVHLVPKDYRLVNLSQNIIFAQLINYNLIKGPKLQ